MTQTSSSSNLYPQATTRLTMAKQDLDQFGYCLLENALSPEATTALRSRLVEQAEAEIQRGLDYQGNDGTHMVWFLLNKGQLFRDLLTRFRKIATSLYIEAGRGLHHQGNLFQLPKSPNRRISCLIHHN